MTKLEAAGLGLQADGKTILEHASFCLAPGVLTAVLGANGAGKTSLLRTSLGIIRPTAGIACIDGEDTTLIQPSSRARKVAYLPQLRPLAWPNRVRDVVALGRFAHGAALGRFGQTDRAAIERAINACDLLHLADRQCNTLSGGELARVHCARAFAAEAPLLIADEPIAALDPRHQFRILDLIRAFVDDGGGALLVLHDVALAVRYADRLIWMKEGRVIAEGSVKDTLTSELLANTYGVNATVVGHSVDIKGAL